MHTVMHIECALHPVHFGRWIVSGLKPDYIIVHDLREVTPTMKSLACSLAWLVMALVMSWLLSWLLQQCWERKRLVSNLYCSVVLLCFYISPQCYTKGASFRTAFQHHPCKLI